MFEFAIIDSLGAELAFLCCGLGFKEELKPKFLLSCFVKLVASVKSLDNKTKHCKIYERFVTTYQLKHNF